MDFGRSKCCKWPCIIRSGIYPSRNLPTNSFEEAYLYVDFFAGADRVLLLDTKLYFWRLNEASASRGSIVVYQRYIPALVMLTLHYRDICSKVGASARITLALQRRWCTGMGFLCFFTAMSDPNLSRDEKAMCVGLTRSALKEVCEKSGIGWRILPRKYWPLYPIFVRWHVPGVVFVTCWLRYVVREMYLRFVANRS